MVFITSGGNIVPDDDTQAISFRERANCEKEKKRKRMEKLERERYMTIADLDSRSQPHEGQEKEKMCVRLSSVLLLLDNCLRCKLL